MHRLQSSFPRVLDHSADSLLYLQIYQLFIYAIYDSSAILFSNTMDPYHLNWLPQLCETGDRFCFPPL